MSEVSAKGLAELVGQIVGYVSVLAAILVYFGWNVTNTRYRYLGIPLSAFDFGPDDYVLRSVSVVYRPLGLVAVLALIVITASRALARRVRLPASLRRPLRFTALVGATWLVVVGAGATVFDMWRFSVERYWFGPAYLTSGILLIERLCATTRRSDRVVSAIRLAVLLLGLFWTAASYAVTVGVRDARRVERDPDRSFPRATIVSRSAIEVLEGAVPSVRVERDGVATYRYEGLRFVARTGSYLILLPATFTSGVSHGVLVSDTDIIALQILSIRS